MEVLAAHQRQDDAVGVNRRAFLKDIGGKDVVTERATAPYLDPCRNFLLENVANLTDRHGIDSHNHFDCFHACKSILHIAQRCAQTGRIPVLYR